MATTLYARSTNPPAFWADNPSIGEYLSFRTTARRPTFGADVVNEVPAVQLLTLSPDIGTGTGVGVTVSTVAGPTAGKRAADTWLSAPLSADVTISSTVTFNLCGSESSMNANIALKGAVYRIDHTGAATLIAEATGASEVGTGLTRQSPTATPTSTACKKGDRIMFCAGIDDGGGNMASGFTGTIQYNGSNANTADSNVVFTETISFIASDPIGSSVYLTDDASDINPNSITAKKLALSDGSASATAVHTTVASPTYPGDQWTGTSGGTDIEWFSAPLDASTLGGVVQVVLAQPSARLEGQVGASPHDILTLEIAVVNNDGTSPTVWAQSYTSCPTDSATALHYLTGPSLAVTQNQRLRFRIYQDRPVVNNSVAGTSRTLRYGGASGYSSWLVFAETLTEFVPASAKPVIISQARQRSALY
jgi:hypothetical protein